MYTEGQDLQNSTDDYDIDYGDEMQDPNCVWFGNDTIQWLYWIVFVLSLFSNILVLVILAKYENFRSLTNTLIMNLALSDLIFTVGLPFWGEYHKSGWRWSEPTCKAVSFMFCVGFYSSGFFLIVMTVQRYLAVIFPLSDILWTRSCFSLLVSMGIWALSVLAATPAVIFSKVQTEGIEKKSHCGYMHPVWRSWGFYQENALFVVSFLVFCFCYGQILLRLLKTPPTRSKRRYRTVKLIFCLFIAFFVVWAPYNVVTFMRTLSFSQFKKNASLNCLFYVFRFISCSHCCLNPVFYVFLGVKFKNHLKKMLQSLCQKGNRPSYRNHRLTITSITSGEEMRERV
ncbi:chemokine XC receptor 1-like [Osmerus mordax]|uniref:chemokine XC receptor 1-like n=1 Tax=Osmerus mordax TaxID=8014 RepID=UPI00350FC658